MSASGVEDEFSVEYWENVWANVKIPQVHDSKDVLEIQQILSSLPIKAGDSLIEIGCAPGRWLAFFAREHGLCVSGVEYAEHACQKTIENMNSLGISAQIHHADIRNFDSAAYDVVFSTGFIEHFDNVAPIMERIISLCNRDGGLVVTIIPNMEGLNRWISKTFRPEVARGHFPLNLRDLTALHESLGLRTLYANYTGGLHVLLPVDKNRFAAEHPRATFLLNLPFRIWNKTVKLLTDRFGLFPTFSQVSSGIIYVGQRG